MDVRRIAEAEVADEITRGNDPPAGSRQALGRLTATP
jgi:hypothetical protein